MGLNVPEKRAHFLENPGNEAADYDVWVIRASPNSEGQVWRCIGVYHLNGSENGGNHHVYLDALDKDGNAIPLPPEIPTPWMVGWTWLDKGGDHLMTPMEKQLPEPPGNIAITSWGQIIDAWMLHPGNTVPSDVVKDLHFGHPDEEPGNTRGHHSMYCLWQLQVIDGTEPPTEPPFPERVVSLQAYDESGILVRTGALTLYGDSAGPIEIVGTN